jgi:hypothetical protein
MLLVSLIALLGTGAVDEVTKTICLNDGGAPINVAGKSYPNLENYMSVMYGGSVDFYMCTPVCPCDEVNKDKFKSALQGKGFEYTPDKYRVEALSDLTFK